MKNVPQSAEINYLSESLFNEELCMIRIGWNAKSNEPGLNLFWNEEA